MPSKYSLAPFSDSWALEFAAEAERLRKLFGANLLAVHHIGSTSVPGLAAKPIIDLLPVVQDITLIDEKTETMVSLGYVAWGEYGLAGRRMFTKDRDGWRTHNLHIYQSDSPAIPRHLAFCAYLREHPNSCREYELVKQRAFELHPDEILAYNDAKNAWIKETEKIALDWYLQRKKTNTKDHPNTGD